MTGFSKRKKARKETAAARAEEKDRQARNEMRQEVMLEGSVLYTRSDERIATGSKERTGAEKR